MIKNKKGSMFLIVFFIAIVMIIFYMISLQSRTPSLGIQTATQTERTYNYAELLKDYTQQVASTSLTHASYEEALALTDYNIIDDSQPNLFDINQINAEIAELARQMVNDYLQEAEGQTFGTVVYDETTSIETVNVNVDELGLMEGTVYDNFEATFEGTELNRIVNPETNEESTFEHQYTSQTTCDRFYYLLHVLNQWATTNLITTISCNRIPSVVSWGSGNLPYPSISQETIIEIVEESMQDLQSRFDKDVVCTYTLNDYIARSNPIPYGTEQGVCPENDCSGGCPQGKPNWETEYRDCAGENINIIYDGGDWQPGADAATYYMACGSVGVDHELLINISISCTDYKCQNPISAQGMEHLTLNVGAYIHQTNHKEPKSIDCEPLDDCEVGGGSSEGGGAPEEKDREERDPKPRSKGTSDTS